MIICDNCLRPYVSQTLKAGKNGRVNDAPIYRHRIRNGHCCNHAISARKLEPIIWGKIEQLLLDPSSLKDGYEKALEKERSANLCYIQLHQVISKEIEKLEKMQKNLTEAYTDPEVKMSKTEYLEQRAKITISLKAAAARLPEIEAQLSNLPTREEFENLETFSAKIRKKLSEQDWQTPENKKHILEMLHARVNFSTEGSGTITGWFGEAVGFTLQTPRYSHVRDAY